ncbi:hypothetical protein Tco_0109948 [Tanacetum coccineum]
MEIKIDEWEKSQNLSLEQTNRTDPPPPQAQTEHVNVVFTRSEKSDDSPKTQKDPPPPIIVDNKTKKDKPIKTTKKAITWCVRRKPSRDYNSSTRDTEGFKGLLRALNATVVPTKVMVAPVISISSDTSEESVGSHALRVILFSVIPAIIPVIPEVLVVPADPIVTPNVGAVSVVSPSGVLDLVDYSPSSDFDPSEDSLPPAPDFPLVSPFLCSDDSEADVAPLWIRRRLATLIRPGEVIPFGRPYRTHPNGPHMLLTARKRVRHLPARRLAWRRVSHHSSDHHSSPDSSSSSAPSDHSLSGHTPPDTTDADSSTPQRFVHRSLARTPRHSEAFRHWRSAPLSTPYPPTTLESSLGSSSERSLDSSSPSSRPSRKRCRSPTASVPSSTHVSRSIARTPADLLPPHKRFRDSYLPEDNGEEHIEVDIADAEAVTDVGISEGCNNPRFSVQ